MASREDSNAGNAARPGLVGVVASAGGLVALEQLFTAATRPTGLTFLVVQHAPADRQSLLPELLARKTELAVELGTSGVQLKPDHVYVIPPGMLAAVEDDKLSLRHADRSIRPGDVLFDSLAAGFEPAAGVVLSGDGADGTEGLRELKRAGGVTIAQAPATADHRAMPDSAISANVVDWVLPPQRIIPQLVAWTHAEAEIGLSDAAISAHLSAITAEVLRHLGHDFSSYKTGTLIRRARRRMLVLGLTDAGQYLAHLRASAEEAQLLMKELLIGVTQFFRDPQIFEVLGSQIIPSILNGLGPNQPVRIWVPGCATGEEAYSIAMLVSEQLALRNVNQAVQVFATDIDSDAIATARRARYREETLAELSTERRERFFTREGRFYTVTKSLRDVCVFSTQDLMRDPPFSSVDLVACRNVLIYLQPNLQAKLIPLFHYALKPGGYLLLGPSEGLGGANDLFDAVDRAKRIFRRREVVGRAFLDLPVRGRALHLRAQDASGARASDPISTTSSFERVILDEYAPAGAVIDQRGEALYYTGRCGRYLRPSPGAPTRNLLDQLRGNLRRTVRGLLASASTEHRKKVRDQVQLEGEDGQPGELVRVTVWPILSPSGAPVFGLMIQSLGRLGSLPEDASPLSPDEVPVIEQLENDLRATRVELQSTVEELESANEELQSSNEELQSSNEELHTSQEELQSVNEELATVNAELQRRVIELNAVNTDLQNLFAADPVATIFLDRELNVTRFTPAARSLFAFIDADIGRPLSSLAPRFTGIDLRADIDEVMRRLEPIEHEARSLDGNRSYIVRTGPYRLGHGEVGGTVIVFLDVTALKEAEAGVRLRADLIELSSDAIFVWSRKGGVELWNRGAHALFNFNENEARGCDPHTLLESDAGEPWPTVLGRLRETGRWEGFVSHRTHDGRRVITSARLQWVSGADGRSDRIFESHRDVTQQRKDEAAVRAAAERLRLASEASGAATFDVDLTAGRLDWATELRGPFEGAAGLLRTLDDLLAAIHPDDRARVHRSITNTDPLKDESVRAEFRLLRPPPEERWGRISGIVSRGSGHDPHRILRGATWDVTLRKQSERAMFVNDRLESLGVMAGGIAHDFNNLLTALFGHLAVARRADKLAEVRSHVDDALEAFERASALSQQLLTFAKGGAPKRSVGDIAKVVESATRFALSGSAVRLKFEFAPDLWPCSFDSNQIARVFENLALNAQQAMPRGGSVAVSAANEVLAAVNPLALPGGQYVKVSVSDSGSGIAPDHLRRIFDPFFTTKPNGSGLGLATAYSILRQHDGLVDVTSTPDTGTTFDIWLPAATAIDAVRAPNHVSGSASPMRVLVMDDQEALRRVIEAVLTAAGHCVLLASGGTEAVETLASERAAGRQVDVVLLDLTVPGGKGGQAVVGELRALDPKVALVAMSGYATDPVMAQPAAFGFTDSICKPMREADFDALFLRISERSRS